MLVFGQKNLKTAAEVAANLVSGRCRQWGGGNKVKRVACLISISLSLSGLILLPKDSHAERFIQNAVGIWFFEETIR